MSGLRIGSLFSGYGGLDLAAEHVTGGRTVWVSDVDPGALEPVDVLCGGSPCQDLSTAGRRAGIDNPKATPYRRAIREAS